MGDFNYNNDFYTIACFETKGWYVNKMRDLGMSPTRNWKMFVEEEIGDLEKWIMENRPEN